MTEITKVTPSNSEEIIKILNPLVKDWFFKKFNDFSQSQKYGVMSIYNNQSILISAPTGGGKTLTAFLSILNKLINLAEKGRLEDKVYCVYCSPLKALNNDIYKNLLEPLKEIEEIAKSRKINLQKIRIALRTGDTTSNEKSKMIKNPPHILITTPESLAIVLTTKKFIEKLKKVEYVIVDEIHSLGNKRGTHLSLSLERLNELSENYPIKIGLSATIEPIEEVAKFLVGINSSRKVQIAKVPFDKKIDIDVLTPVKNLIENENPRISMYKLIDKLISEHKTTLIFTNTRSATERVVNYLKEKFPDSYHDLNIAAHHSSLSKKHRLKIEDDLRNGKLKVVICSTSLELGIDIGYIDLVILLGSPKSSSRAVQRIGRAGHRLHENPKGRFIVLDIDDLVECSVIQKEIIEYKIDKIYFPKNCLDVLSQQIYGMAIDKVWDTEKMLSTIRKSYCYKDLSKEDFYSVISYLSGEYNLEKNKIYSKIWYDKKQNKIGKKGKLARMIYMTNIGTIPEESIIDVKIATTGEKIGVIDEIFLNRMKKNDIFVLGGNKYQYKYTRGMNLYVSSEPGKNPTIPSWFSETLPLSFDSALEIGKFRKKITENLEAGKSKEEIISIIKKELYVSEEVSNQIYDYFQKQYNFSKIPHSNLITIEKYIDEINNKNYVIVNSMYGRRVNDALSRALAYAIGQLKTKEKRDVEISVNDSGFYLASENTEIEEALEKINEKNIEEILKKAIEKTDILTRKFRHCATRSLMILRSYKGNTKNIKRQQMKSHFLISTVKKISEEFPILKEAKREILEDLMDIDNAKKVIKWIKEKKIEISIDYVKIPSPFALSILIQGHLDLMKIEEKQDFLKRMHELYQQEISKKLSKKYESIYEKFDW